MTYYRTLGVAPSASPEEITQAYRRLRSSAHPDKQGDAAMFHRIQKAYEVLSDPARRAKYDAGQDDQPVEEDRAMRTLTEMLVNTVTQTESRDPLDTMRENILANMKQHEHNKQVNTRRANKLKKAAERIKRRQGENLLPHALEAHASKLMEQNLGIDLELAFGREMLELLDQYECVPEQFAPPPVYPWNFSGAA